MRFSLLGLCISILMLGCTSTTREQSPKGAIQVKIPLWSAEGYQLTTVSILSVDNLVELKGWAANFLLAPALVDGQLVGQKPKIRTIRNSDGVYVATDELSLELLTIYYHMEQLGMMDELVGAKNVNHWPRTVAVNVNYLEDNHKKLENNALYSGELDSMIFVPYSRTQLPILVNAGIIGHEHFHSLFHKLVVEPLGSKFPQSATLHDEKKMTQALGIIDSPNLKIEEKILSEQAYYHTYFFRGLNEGLADFWGWLYSKDNNFVGQSIVEFRSDRTLEISEKEQEPKLDTRSCFLNKLQTFSSDNKGPGMKAYEFGTRLARLQKVLTEKMLSKANGNEEQIRMLMGKAIIESLPQFAAEFKALPDDQMMEPSRWLEILQTHLVDYQDAEVKQWMNDTLEKSRPEKGRAGCRGNASPRK